MTFVEVGVLFVNRKPNWLILRASYCDTRRWLPTTRRLATSTLAGRTVLLVYLRERLLGLPVQRFQVVQDPAIALCSLVDDGLEVHDRNELPDATDRVSSSACPCLILS